MGRGEMGNESMGDVVFVLNEINDKLANLIAAARDTEDAVNKWGAELEARLSYIESNTSS
jgi:hypothetical protein